VEIAGEIDAVAPLVDAGHSIHLPIAMGESGPAAAIEPVEVGKTGPLRAPDQAAVAQRFEIVVEVEPGLRPFGEQDRRPAGGGIDAEQIELLLVATLALDEQGAAVRPPVRPCEIDVRIVAQIDLDAG